MCSCCRHRCCGHSIVDEEMKTHSTGNDTLINSIKFILIIHTMWPSIVYSGASQAFAVFSQVCLFLNICVLPSFDHSSICTLIFDLKVNIRIGAQCTDQCHFSFLPPRLHAPFFHIMNKSLFVCEP